MKSKLCQPRRKVMFCNCDLNQYLYELASLQSNHEYSLYYQVCACGSFLDKTMQLFSD